MSYSPFKIWIPQNTVLNFKQKITLLLFAVSLIIIGTLISNYLLDFLFTIMNKHLGCSLAVASQTADDILFDKLTFTNKFFLLVIAVPIIEEMFWRFYITYTKDRIVFVLLYLVVLFSYFFSNPIYLVVTALLIHGLFFVWIYHKKQIHDLFDNEEWFNRFIYMNAIVFVLIHIDTYVWTFLNCLATVIDLSLMFVLSLYLYKLRISAGIHYAIVLHGFNNFFALLC